LHNVNLSEAAARQFLHRCEWVSLIPIFGFIMVLVLATIGASLPSWALKPAAFAALILIVGGDLYFCHCMGRLAAGLGQSASAWRSGIWIASKFLAFIAWWLALLKMRSLVNRTFAAPPVIIP
jgi:hypothetical protein